MDPVAQLCETGEDRFCGFLGHRKSWIGSRQSSCSCFQSFVSLDGLECSRISLMSVKEDTSQKSTVCVPTEAVSGLKA